MSKKILNIIIILAILLGGYFWYTNQNQKKDEVQNEIKIEEIEDNPEILVQEINKVDQEEDEIDKMIDELEELNF